jgi:hypothetical protein
VIAVVMSSRVVDESIAQLETQLERALAERDHYRELYLRTLEQCRRCAARLADGSAIARLANDG